MPSPSDIPHPDQTFVVLMQCDATDGYVATNWPFPQAIPNRSLAPPKNIDSRPPTTTSDAPVLGSGPIWGSRESIAASHAAHQSHEAMSDAHLGAQAGGDVPALATYPSDYGDYYSTSAPPGSAQGVSTRPSSERAAEVACWLPQSPYFAFAHSSAGSHAGAQADAAWLRGQQFAQGFTHAEWICTYVPSISD
ncbi:hypothetical protein DAEQUDRAFT_766352 [Daedalea quercina L-15889]|uniref:Uncharacterized protein n=1 Tax=Daedalea quercina L-15889 TaxID=1314783 RepID=A0A165PLH8_9APHY|nr:hypothetical protein DAEQUDRAFT_766352 [Daedalea quercina L-15889]